MTNFEEIVLVGVGNGY